MYKYIKLFRDISLFDSGIYGGKTASLGEMMRSGIPVPDGFGNSTQAQVDFSDKPFSDAFLAELKEAFTILGLKRVAVRSSAIAEDSGDESWAGQLESYLNVMFEDIEASVRDCWRSIRSEHALAYAQGKGLSDNDLLVGVAVQSMIASEMAGVMFTVDPASGNKDHCMIEGLYGLGEMLVQGIVTPDMFIVEKHNDEIVELRIDIKSKRMVFLDGKNVVEDLPIEIGDRAVLREKQVIELTRIGKRIENHYGRPMDIEWAYEGGKFYIVQARPITTL